jgi:CheY-like chemotaxis protein
MIERLLVANVSKAAKKPQVRKKTGTPLLDNAKPVKEKGANIKHDVHILLAEDNLINRKLVSYMLTKAGYRLDIAENGREAVNHYLSSPGSYSLIFMDVQMPEMDGMEATRKIREKEKQLKNKIQNFPPIPIIAMTAQSMKGDYEKCLEAGMNDYVSKPIRRSVVLEMVEKWAGSRKM